MENASKALLMAAGVLIGILLFSLAIYLFADFGSTSSNIHKQVERQQLIEFNNKFTSHTNKETITIYDIITLAGYARENNEYYKESNVFENEYKIEISINGKDLTKLNEDQLNKLIVEDTEKISNTNSLPEYTCKKIDYHKNGRIKLIYFN